MKEVTRRDFARSAGLATALSYSRILGANDRVGLGYVGLGNRGDHVHDAFLEHGDCRTVAVCDLRQDYVDFAVKKSRATPNKYKEYSKLLEDKDVDAVVIATPDHWHALMFIDACNARKDVYVEKPLSLTVVEGRKMVETADRTQRVTQVGTNRRSWKSYQEAAEFVRSGGIGHVSVARCFHVRNEWPVGLGVVPDSAPPSDWEWDHWLGPAPKVPYSPNRTYYNFRWFYDYSGGQLTNFGVHYVDVIRWCLGQDSPRSVTAIGGKYAGIQDNREIPDTLAVLWEFGGPTLVVFEQYNANGAPGTARDAEMELRGTKGTMYIRYANWEVVPEKIAQALEGYDQGNGYGNPLDRAAGRRIGASLKPAMEPASRQGSAEFDTTAHARNFLDCIKTRAKCNADVLTGHISTTAALIGNIAHKTRSHLDWNAKAERFTNNESANDLLNYEYRAPYKLG
ncbi:MAG TPA: Gfo/Idh/MocA family oxidoreductase [Bryobacteraceae bacterium]|nr:Gfo/Idh/MocA family oxidoreductase [Bryobacteraceae bacterium]